MELKLDQAIADYVNASNQQDTERIVAVFAADAVVEDEGERFEGIEQIRGWIDAQRRKYTVKLEPIAQKEQSNGEQVMTAIVMGNFKGSPVQLDFRFKAEKNRIIQLAIG